MKKVWVLLRKNQAEFKQDDESIPFDPKSLNTKFIEVVKSANYYKFCSEVKKEFGRADRFAIDELKKTLTDGVKTEESTAQFRDTHNRVRDSYHVIQGEVADNVKDYSEYDFVKDCDNIKRFLWGTKY